MIKLIYNNRTGTLIFDILNECSIKLSSSEVTFNNIKIDFTGHSTTDFPYKYSEVKIIECNTLEDINTGNYEVKFFGYVDSFELNSVTTIEEDRILELVLLSPLKLSTMRYINIVGQYNLKKCIRKILEPLENDGFIIKVLDINEHIITASYVLENIEYIMNDICNKYSLFWFINEKKEIFIYEITNLFDKDIKSIINCSREQEIYYINPSITTTEYANVINIKNIRLYYSEEDESGNMGLYPIINLPRNLKNGDTITLNNSFDVLENNLRTIIEEEGENRKYYNIYIKLEKTGEQYKEYSIGIDRTLGSATYNTYITSGSITYSTDEGNEGEVVLQVDNFFNNLITGIKFNLEDGWKITKIETDTALRYTQMKFINSREIENMKGIVSNSGQIEKIIDYNEQWATLKQLIKNAHSEIIDNTNVINQIDFKSTKNLNLNVGDIVYFNRSDFMCEGYFAVTDIDIKIMPNDLEISYTTKKSDLFSTFIELFRPTKQQVSSNVIENIILSDELEEGIIEVHEVV